MINQGVAEQEQPNQPFVVSDGVSSEGSESESDCKRSRRRETPIAKLKNEVKEIMLAVGKIIQLLSMGSCCEFFASTYFIATILCFPPCPTRTTITSSARGNGRQWPDYTGTSKYLSGVGSFNSYANTNRRPSLSGFKGNGIK